MGNFPYFKPGEEDHIAYIRAVRTETLPEELQEQTRGIDVIYAIHDSEGQVLALVDDREKAFIVARMNEMQPMSVH